MASGNDLEADIKLFLLWAQTFFDQWLELAIGNFQPAVAGYCQIDLQPVFALGQMPERDVIAAFLRVAPGR